MSPFLLYTACGTYIYAVCAGFRDNYGIMLPYIVGEKSLPYASTSLIIALGQLFFGLMQPVFGYIALRKSARFALFCGVTLILTGLALIPWSREFWQLAISLGILLPSGTAAASFGILMSCISPRLSGKQGPVAAGIVGGGIGIGICVLSPILQSWLAGYGIFYALTLLSIPVLMLFGAATILTRGLSRRENAKARKPSFGQIMGQALKNKGYLLVAFAFFTCGFHMALIQTHLFSQLTAFGISAESAAWFLSIYGLGVLGGSIGSGLGSALWPMQKILAVIISSRCIWILVLFMPLHPIFLALDIFMLGITGVSALTPIAGLIQRLFGSFLMPTLFGAVYLGHQVGAFASAWAGGICLELTNNYNLIWYADCCLCLMATLACLKIRIPAKPE